MTDKTMQLKPAKIALEKLFLDPNNPRLAKSLNLRTHVEDEGVAAAQTDLARLFVNDSEADPIVDDEDWQSGEGSVGIGDLVRSMQEIGFVPVDQVVVRRLADASDNYLVIEGNRRVAAAKFLSNAQPSRAYAERRPEYAENLATLKELDVLVLPTEGLSLEEVHHQIGVILGLRHFGQVLPWGTLARAVNIYHEYLRMAPAQTEFKLDASRISRVATLLSENRGNVLGSLKTYIAYQQLKEAFSSQLSPSHYSLLQACVVNKKLAAHDYLIADKTTFRQTEESLERLNAICEFEHRDQQGEQNILPDPKAVSKFAQLVADAHGNPDVAVRGVASLLLENVLEKDKQIRMTVEDAAGKLRLFTADRKWVHSLRELLEKVALPTELEVVDEGRLQVKAFDPAGNELMALDEARKAFKNVRRIFSR